VFVTNEKMHPSISLRINDKSAKYYPKALKAYKVGWSLKERPKWVYVDEGEGEGAVWKRPLVQEKKGFIGLGKQSLQREIDLKEWIVEERPGMMNFEVRLLPTKVRELLDKRNRMMMANPTF
jgi:hypothetical protein